MSYRYFIAKMSKDEYKQLSTCKSTNCLQKKYPTVDIKDDSYFYLSTLLHNYSIDQIADECFVLDKGFENQFFKDKTFNTFCNGKFIDNDRTLFKINQNDFLKLIEIYEKSIKDSFQNKIDEIKMEKNLEDAIETMTRYLKYKLNKWEDDYVLNKKHENKERIVNDESYEYCVFDLLHLYKNTDFDKEQLFIFGH
jgi:hypothetical protein